MGETRADHFAHVGTACEGASEHALREKLKELLEKEGYISLPQSVAEIEGKSHELVEGGHAEIGEVKCLSEGDPCRPQIEIHVTTGEKEDETIIAEISFGRKRKHDLVGEEPKTFAEIDLSELGDDYSEEKLRDVVLGSISCFKWIRREKADKEADLIREELRIEKIRTTEAEKQRLLQQARISRDKNQSSKIYYNVPEFDVSRPEVVIEEKQRTVYSIQGFYTCYACSTKGLTADDMAQFNTKNRKGYCKSCRHTGRARAHRNANGL